MGRNYYLYRRDVGTDIPEGPDGRTEQHGDAGTAGQVSERRNVVLRP